MSKTIDASENVTITVTADELTFDHISAGPDTMAVDEAERIADLIGTLNVGESVTVGKTTVTCGGPKSETESLFTFGDEIVVERITTDIDDLKDAVDSAAEIGDDFVEYVKSIENLLGANDVQRPDDAGVVTDADVVVSYDFLSTDEMQAFEDDDGVRFAKSRAKDGDIYVGLNDDR